MATIEETVEDLAEKLEELTERGETQTELFDSFHDKIEDLKEELETVKEGLETVKAVVEKLREVLTKSLEMIDNRRHGDVSLTDDRVADLSDRFKKFSTTTQNTLAEVQKKLSVIDQTQFDRLMDDWMKSRNPLQKTFEENTDGFINTIMDKLKGKLGG